VTIATQSAARSLLNCSEFKDMEVYDGTQDWGKGIGQQLYEALIGGAATVLDNRFRGQIATRARSSLDRSSIRRPAPGRSSGACSGSPSGGLWVRGSIGRNGGRDPWLAPAYQGALVLPDRRSARAAACRATTHRRVFVLRRDQVICRRRIEPGKW